MFEIVVMLFFISVFLLLFVIYYNALANNILKINEAESKIDASLRKRYDLLKKASIIIKESLNINKKVFEKLDDLNNKKISNFDFDRKLITYIDELYLINEKYDELKTVEDLQKICFEINDTDDLLRAYKDYYNDYIQKYNKLVSTFPSIIVAKVKRYKIKLFYDRKNMADDDFKDFKI